MTEIEEREYLQGLNAVALRSLARDKRGKATWLGSASKEACINYILTGEVPAAVATVTARQASTGPDMLKAWVQASAMEVLTPETITARVGDIIQGEDFGPRFKELLRETIFETGRHVILKRLEDSPGDDLGVQHEKFPVLLGRLNIRKNVYIHGPSGTGKTKAAMEAAKCLGLPLYIMSFCAQTPFSRLTGFTKPDGTVVTTPFLEAYEKGGLILLDEWDSANPSIQAEIGGAIETGSSGWMFGNKWIAKHADFRCVAAGNTVLLGASREHVGRQAADRATRERFVFLYWGFDSALEASLCPDNAWRERCLAIRKAVESFKGAVQVFCGARAMIDGAGLLSIGEPQAEVEESVIWKGADEDTKAKVYAIVGRV